MPMEITMANFCAVSSRPVNHVECLVQKSAYYRIVSDIKYRSCVVNRVASHIPCELYRIIHANSKILRF